MELKIVEKNGLKWIEIRKQVKGCNIQIFVSKGGWINKQEYAKPENKPKSGYYSMNVSDYNVRWSQNGSAFLTFEDFKEITDAIEKAKQMIGVENA